MMALKDKMSSSDNSEQDPRMEGILPVLAHVGILALQLAASSLGNGKCHLQGLIKQFLKLNPSRFIGMGNSEEVESWIDGMKKKFTLLDYNDVDKIALAEDQLQGNASHWWRASKGMVFPTGVTMTWTCFVKAFYEKYFLDCARDKIVVEST